MRTSRDVLSTALAAVTIVAVSSASAQLPPLPPPAPPASEGVEDFEGGLNGFIAPPEATVSAVTEAGNTFARVTAEVPVLEPGNPITASTLLANNDAPGSVFTGNYTAGQIETVLVDVRHDAAEALTFALRLTATPFSFDAAFPNFPGIIAFDPAEVEAGDGFTTLSFGVSESLFTPANEALGLVGFEASPAFSPLILESVANFQFLVNNTAEPLGGPVTFEVDNIRLVAVPGPGGAAAFAAAGLLAARRRR